MICSICKVEDKPSSRGYTTVSCELCSKHVGNIFSTSVSKGICNHCYFRILEEHNEAVHKPIEII